MGKVVDFDEEKGAEDAGEKETSGDDDIDLESFGKKKKKNRDALEMDDLEEALPDDDGGDELDLESFGKKKMKKERVGDLDADDKDDDENKENGIDIWTLETQLTLGTCTSKISSVDTTANLVPRSELFPNMDHASSEVKYQEKTKKSNGKKATWTPRTRILMDDESKALLEKVEVKEKYAADCLYGDDIDKFKELVTLVAVQNKISEDEVKIVLSNNRRKVKNREAARRS